MAWGAAGLLNASALVLFHWLLSPPANLPWPGIVKVAITFMHTVARIVIPNVANMFVRIAYRACLSTQIGCSRYRLERARVCVTTAVCCRAFDCSVWPARVRAARSSSQPLSSQSSFTRRACTPLPVRYWVAGQTQLAFPLRACTDNAQADLP